MPHLAMFIACSQISQRFGYLAIWLRAEKWHMSGSQYEHLPSLLLTRWPYLNSNIWGNPGSLQSLKCTLYFWCHSCDLCFADLLLVEDWGICLFARDFTFLPKITCSVRVFQKADHLKYLDFSSVIFCSILHPTYSPNLSHPLRLRHPSQTAFCSSITVLL